MTRPQHPLGLAAALALLPGTTGLVGQVLLHRFTSWPAYVVSTVETITVFIPVVLAVLLIAARRETGRWSLRALDGLIRYRHRPGAGRLVALAAALIVWGALVAFVIAPLVDPFVQNSMFGWLPEWFRDGYDDTSGLASSSAVAIGVAYVVSVVRNGVVAPVAEEVYFRGYLLPRVDRLGWRAPVVNGVLFTLYHLMSPWLFVSRVLQTVPLAFAVWRMRSIQVGIVVHCTVNTLSTTLLFVAL